MDRLATKTLPEGAVAYTYDATGNMTSAANYNGSKVVVTYDADNRKTQSVQTLPSGYSATIGYVYDPAGNRTSMTTPWGTFRYTYDAMNRMTSVTNPEGKAFAFVYDTDGRRSSLTYPNGIKTTYAYDAASQLTQVLHKGIALNQPVAFTNYTYDLAGNRTSMIDMAGTHGYTYDVLNRLTAAAHPAASNLPDVSETFTYDAVGNRTSDDRITNYHYNAVNELISNSSFTYAYDANGNLTSKSDNAGTRTLYGYDSQNELTGVQLPGGTAVAYKYDALGRRIFRSTGTATSQTYQFIYDNQDILAILDGNNSLVALFTHGPGIDESLELHQGGGVDYFLHTDGLGSIVEVTDSNGTAVEHIEYAGFGQPIFFDERGATTTTEHSSFTGNPYAFTGREWDAESGLYFYRARYYSPTIGRFIQQDPLGFGSGTINLYAYVTNAPLRHRDPNGTSFDLRTLMHCLVKVGAPATGEEIATHIAKEWAEISAEAGPAAEAAGALDPQMVAAILTSVGLGMATNEFKECMEEAPPPKLPKKKGKMCLLHGGPILRQGPVPTIGPAPGPSIGPVAPTPTIGPAPEPTLNPAPDPTIGPPETQ